MLNSDLINSFHCEHLRSVNLRFCIYNKGTRSSVPIGTQMVALWVINTTHLGLGDEPQCQRHYQVCAEWQVISASLISTVKTGRMMTETYKGDNADSV